MNLVKVQIFDFMCYKDFVAEINSNCIILTGENQDARKAFLIAIEFLLDPKYIDSKKVRKVLLPWTIGVDGFVRLFFRSGKTGAEFSAVRYLLAMKTVFIFKEGIKSSLSIEEFHIGMETTLSSFLEHKTFDDLQFPQYENLNLLEVFDKKEREYPDMTLHEMALSARLPLAFNQVRKELSSIEDLKMRKRILKMLQISKHPNHRHEMNMAVLEEILPLDACFVAKIYSLKHFLMLNEISERIQTQRIEVTESLIENTVKEYSVTAENHQFIQAELNRSKSVRSKLLAQLCQFDNLITKLDKIYKISGVDFRNSIKTKISKKYYLIRDPVERTQLMKKDAENVLREITTLEKELLSIENDNKAKLKPFSENIISFQKNLNEYIEDFSIRSKECIQTYFEGISMNKVILSTEQTFDIYNDSITELRSILPEYYSWETIEFIDELMNIRRHHGGFSEKDDCSFEITVTERGGRIKKDDISIKIMLKLEFSFPKISIFDSKQLSFFKQLLKRSSSVIKLETVDENLLKESEKLTWLEDKRFLERFLNEMPCFFYKSDEQPTLFSGPFIENRLEDEKILQGGYLNLNHHETYKEIIKYENFIFCKKYVLENMEMLEGEKTFDEIFEQVLNESDRTVNAEGNVCVENVHSIWSKLLSNKTQVYCILKKLMFFKIDAITLSGLIQHFEPPIAQHDFFDHMYIFNEIVEEELTKTWCLEEEWWHPDLQSQTDFVLLEFKAHASTQWLQAYSYMIETFDETVQNEIEEKHTVINDNLQSIEFIRLAEKKASEIIGTRKEWAKKLIFPLEHANDELQFTNSENDVINDWKERSFSEIDEEFQRVEKEIPTNFMEPERLLCIENYLKGIVLWADCLNELETDKIAEEKLQWIAMSKIILKFLTHDTMDIIIEEDNAEETDTETEIGEILNFININDHPFYWKSLPGHLKFIIHLSLQIGKAVISRQKVLIIRDMHLLKHNYNLQLAQTLVWKTLNSKSAKDFNKESFSDFFDLLAELSTQLQVTFIFEYDSMLNVKNSQIINCTKTGCEIASVIRPEQNPFSDLMDIAAESTSCL